MSEGSLGSLLFRLYGIGRGIRQMNNEFPLSLSSRTCLAVVEKAIGGGEYAKQIPESQHLCSLGDVLFCKV